VDDNAFHNVLGLENGLLEVFEACLMTLRDFIVFSQFYSRVWQDFSFELAQILLHANLQLTKCIHLITVSQYLH
jgi:hypothetical protein